MFPGVVIGEVPIKGFMEFIEASKMRSQSAPIRSVLYPGKQNGDKPGKAPIRTNGIHRHGTALYR